MMKTLYNPYNSFLNFDQRTHIFITSVTPNFNAVCEIRINEIIIKSY